MNRTDFLTLCQKVSLLPKGENGIIKYIPQNLTVMYRNLHFYPVGYNLYYLNGKIKHRAILHDLKVHSIINCDLEKVEYNGKV